MILHRGTFIYWYELKIILLKYKVYQKLHIADVFEAGECLCDCCSIKIAMCSNLI